MYQNTWPARGHALVSHLGLIEMPELLAMDAVPTWFLSLLEQVILAFVSQACRPTRKLMQGRWRQPPGIRPPVFCYSQAISFRFHAKGASRRTAAISWRDNPRRVRHRITFTVDTASESCRTVKWQREEADGGTALTLGTGSPTVTARSRDLGWLG